MKKNKRDDFTEAIKLKLAKRVAFICSNPSCQKLTIGPSTNHTINNIGVASHICAASPGGPRYNKNMTEKERKDLNNGIWLCQSCAKLIDSDETKYTVKLLHSWKDEMESTIIYNFGERINLKKKNKLEYIFDTLRDTNNWEQIQEENIDGYYFKENPSYMIEIIDDDNHNTEFYSYLMTNESTSYYTLLLKYNTTCIYSTQVVCLDSSRLKTVVPLSSFVHYDGHTYKYKYFIKNSKEIILRDFLFNYKKGYDKSEEIYAMNRLNEVVIEYETEEEKDYFENKYLKNINSQDIKDLSKEYTYVGGNPKEIKINQNHIGLGLYIKNKYNLYKNNVI